MKKLPVASHLTDNEYKLLLDVYQKHNRSMDFEERKSHTLTDIVKVERNTEENSLIVHYQNGDWWYYTNDGTWH